MKVLGIDPGTAVVGYGVVEDGRTAPRLLECGVIRTGARESLASRLRTISDGVTELIARHQPDVVSIEGIFYSRSVKNVRTTMVLGHARGVILLSAETAGIPIAEYPPAMVKKTVVGRGAAVKAQVGYMCAQLLRLKTPPTPADAADGVALALTHLLRSRLPRLNGIPHRR
jgi:crossover junction endodeoxyribonuclease RuvC